MKRKLNFKIIAILWVMIFLLTGCGSTENNLKEDQNNETKESQNGEEIVSVAKNGAFVEYKDNIYYWKISANSRQSSALFANYTDNKGVKNSLIKMDKNGNEEVLLTDKGSGELFIVNDKIFLSYAEDEYNGKRKIYSVDLNGGNKKEYQTGLMKYIVGDYLICQTQDEGDIFRINTKTDEIESLKKQANIIGCLDETIYYSKIDSSSTGKLEIGSISGKNDNGIIATFSKDNFEEYYEQAPIEVVDFFEKNNKINIYVGYRAGTANILQELFELNMDKDGKNLNITESMSDEVLLEEERSTDEVYLKTVQENGEYKANLMYLDSKTKERKIAMTEDEINSKFGFISDDEHTTTLYIGNVIDDNLYVVLDNGVHNSSEDIGWRYSYKRSKTVCFKFNTKNNEITEIYSF